jgi:phage gpG-like protein
MTHAVNVSIQASPAGLYLNNYRALIRLIDDPRPMWAAIGKRLVESTMERFYEGKDPDGKKWPESGEVRYNKKLWGRASVKQVIDNLVDFKRSTRTMVRSGKLATSFHYRTSKDGVLVFSSSKYGRPHQFGYKIKAKNQPYLKFKTSSGWKSVKSVLLPERKFMGITTKDRDMIRKIVRTYIVICFSGTGIPQ